MITDTMSRNEANDEDRRVASAGGRPATPQATVQASLGALPSSLATLSGHAPRLDRARCPLTLHSERRQRHTLDEGRARAGRSFGTTHPAHARPEPLRASFVRLNVQLVSVTRGWGDIDNVFVQAAVFPCQDRDALAEEIHRAVDAVMGEARHATHVLWEEDGSCLVSEPCPLWSDE